MDIKGIKQRLSILTVAGHYGLKPNKYGMVRCPFHEDNNPSLKLYKETNTFNCFGCPANGDAIEFIQQKEQCTKHEAILKAKAMAGITEIKTMPTTKPKNENHTDLSAESANKAEKVEILTKIFTYFQNGLNKGTTKRPKEYLQSRNLNPEKLEVGYNSGQFHHRGKLSEADTKACIDAGLLTPYKGSVPYAKGTSYTSFAKDCITFPLKNKQNQIVSLYGRRATDDVENKHYYLKGRAGLYPKYPNPNTTKLILTESIIDAATLLQIPEITNTYEILACYGVNGLTNEHLQAIKELQKLEEITFFFDGDQAGEEAINKYKQILNGLLPHTRLSAVETPENEDINSLSVAYENNEVFTHLLEHRQDLLLLPENTETSKSETPQEPTVRSGKLNTKNPDYITLETEGLLITLLGGISLQQLDRLRVTLKIQKPGSTNPLHSIRHTIDLYHTDYLEKFINKASEQLETGTTGIRKAIAELTNQIEQYRLSKLENHKKKQPTHRQLTEQQYSRAVNYLKAPRLMERTNQDIGRAGIIGEENNRLLMYLTFTSRLREQPLHIISLGASGTGKTYLQEKIAELIPEQEKMEITILSENAFYYFERKELKNKLVLIEDMDGAQDVLYPLRELQSKKKISKTIPIKDSKGNLKTITMHVEGPISLAGTTTKERLYEDNANRSLLIYLDNSSQHNENIMEYQRKLSAGKINTREEHQIKEFFKDMQSVLKPIKVRNPYAEYLKIPEYVFKPLRTNAHYLAVIETITFYHQYQREIKTDPQTGEHYIETTLEDIEWANKLLKTVLLAKADELNKAERSFFERLKNWLKSNDKTSFYAKDIREAFRMHPSKIKRYLYSLTTYNLIKITGGSRYKTGYEYEVLTTEEYKQLENTVNTVLDNTLENIRQKISGSGGSTVGYGQNGPLNNKGTNKINAVAQ